MADALDPVPLSSRELSEQERAAMEDEDTVAVRAP